MPFSYRIETEPPLCRIRGLGDVDMAAYRKFSGSIFEDPAWRPGMPILCDYRGLERFGLEAPQLRETASRTEEFRAQIGDSRLAILTDSDFVFGMNRMWEAYTEGTGIAFGVFRDPREAEAFLGLPEGAVDAPDHGG